MDFTFYSTSLNLESICELSTEGNRLKIAPY